MPNLDISDAIELAEMLEFIADWMGADRACLATSLARFVGPLSDGYTAQGLIDDLNRFRFLLGMTDGEGVFAPGEQWTPVLTMPWYAIPAR